MYMLYTGREACRKEAQAHQGHLWSLCLLLWTEVQRCSDSCQSPADHGGKPHSAGYRPRLEQVGVMLWTTVWTSIGANIRAAETN